MRPLHLCLLSGDPRLPYEYGVDGRFGEGDVEAVRQARIALEALGGYRVEVLDDHDRLFERLRSNPPDLVLNFCDTGYRNQLRHESNVPALLELFDIPYTGANPACMSICGDKALVRLLAANHGIPVPNETFVDLSADPLPLPERYPALIKPNAGCGSVGVTPDSVVTDARQAQACLEELALDPDRPQALIQDFLTGPEYTLGLVGNPATGFTVLPLLEIDYSALPPELPPILSYGSKADPDSAYWQALRFKPAELAPEVQAAVVEHSVFLFERLGFRDYARFDYRCGADGVPRLLDANFNPTWSADGKMAIMAGWAGYDYADLLALLLNAARQRYGL